MPPATDGVADFVGGFVAAEANFRSVGNPPSFFFSVGLGAVDRAMCHGLRAFFGVGSVHWRKRRRAHYDDEVTFQVRALRDLVEVVVPFMDEHLPSSHKREQYSRWRKDLLSYWEAGARRPHGASRGRLG